MKKYFLCFTFALISLASSAQGTYNNKSQVILNTGYTFPVANYPEKVLKFNALWGGYILNRALTLGVGTGLHHYFDHNYYMLPVYLYSRLSFPKRVSSPFLQLAYGQGFNLSQRFEREGFMVQAEIGYQYAISKKLVSYLSMGIDAQILTTKYKYYGSYTDYVTGELKMGPSLNLGVIL